MKTAFIGHRRIFVKDIFERLVVAIENEINSGCKTFTMGIHGDFDRLALSACRQLRNSHKDLKIEVVITSLNVIRKENSFDDPMYSDVETVMYDIENAHYKQQITLSNFQMIDSCDTLICYVDPSTYRSGAKTAMKYAKKHGLKIINLFREEDNPLCNLTKEESTEYIENSIREFLGKK